MSVVERELLLDSSVDEVWAALTEPDRLEQWFANDVELEPCLGGRARFAWANGETRDAVIDDIEPEERLVLRWLDDDGIVRLELESTDTGTTLRIVETSPEFTAALELRALAACAAV